MESEEEEKSSTERQSSPEDSKPQPDSPPEAESGTAEEAVPKNVPLPRGPKKRTKTGCLSTSNVQHFHKIETNRKQLTS